MLLRLFFALLTIIKISSAQAAEFYEPFQSIRQLGMGGVYIFDEHDAGGFIQNPAYTCYAKGFNWTIFNVGLGIGDIQAYMDLTESTGSLPDTSSFSGLSPFYGKNIWLNLGGFTSVMLPCFGFAGTYSGTANFSLHNPAYPTLDTFYLSEYGLRAGGAIPLGPFLSFGLALKRMNRTGGPYTFGPDSLANMAGSNAIADLVSDVQNEGVGYGIDAGLVSRFSMLPMNPTLSLSWRDVGSTSYLMTKGTDAPERQKDNLVLGATVNSSLLIAGFAAGVEYRHITDQGEQIGKKIHAGAEISLAFLDARAGFYQGYTTYGFGINLWLVQIDAAWYKVEKGIYPGQTPDERAQIGILFDLEFDPNFNLVDTNGRKRRLKQRR